MTDTYNYPQNAHYTPSEIQKNINIFKKMVLDEQEWLRKCLLHSDDSKIKTLLANIKDSEDKATEFKNEWNEVIERHERGPVIVQTLKRISEMITARQKLAEKYMDNLTVYIRTCDNDGLVKTQEKIDQYNTCIVQYEEDKLRRESVLREMAQEHSLHPVSYTHLTLPTIYSV